MRELAIIADDLASATDCGIQVAKSGLLTVVPLSLQGISGAAQTADVVSVDTDTRSASTEQAYRQVKAVTELVAQCGFRNIYKSIDSTLRGNLGAEINGVMDAFPVDLAVIAPAFPLYGRTTLGGKHFLHGVPINATEFGTDPQRPVRDDDLVRLIASQSGRKTGLVGLADIRQGDGPIAWRLEQLSAQGTALVVFDAEEEADLDRIVHGVAADGARVLWVGSTGMARCIPSALGVGSRHQPDFVFVSDSDRVMVVVGSASETSRDQLRSLMAARKLATVEMNPFRVIGDEVEAHPEIDRCRSLLLQALSAGDDVVLHVASSRKDVGAAQAQGRAAGLTPIEVSGRIAAALAGITRLVVEEFAVRGIALTGGDTAKAVCGALGAIGIRLWKDIEPGIPLGQVIGPHELLIVTKAGAFGTPHALIRSLDAMKQNAVPTPETGG